MDKVTMIVNAVSTVGFPIAMCLIFCYYINQQGARHREENKEFIKAIQDNTLALQHLCDLINTGKDDEE